MDCNVPDLLDIRNDLIIIFTDKDSARCTKREDAILTPGLASSSVALLKHFKTIRLFQQYKLNDRIFYRPIKGTIEDYVASLVSASEFATDEKDPRINPKVLGEGTYGEVIQYGDSPIATKTSKNSKHDHELLIESLIPSYIRDDCCITEALNISAEGVDMRLSEGDLFTYAFEIEPPPTLRIMKDWIYDIVKGLYYTHSAGFCHRDLKPENIFMYEKNGKIRAEIGDWGTAKFMPYTSFSLHGGTYEYLPIDAMIPRRVGSNWFEHWRGGPEVDIFALGVMIYFLFSGRQLSSKMPLNSDLKGIPEKTRGLISSIYGDLPQDTVMEIIHGTLYTPVVLENPNVPRDILPLIKKMLDLRNRPSITDIISDPIFRTYGETFEPITASSILKKNIRPINGYLSVWNTCSKVFLENCTSLRHFLLYMYYMNSYVALGLADDIEAAMICSIIYGDIIVGVPSLEIDFDRSLFFKGKEIPMFVSLPFTFFKDLYNPRVAGYLIDHEMRSYRNVNPYAVAVAIQKKTNTNIFTLDDIEVEQINLPDSISEESEMIMRKIFENTMINHPRQTDEQLSSWWSENYYYP